MDPQLAGFALLRVTIVILDQARLQAREQKPDRANLAVRRREVEHVGAGRRFCEPVACGGLVLGRVNIFQIKTIAIPWVIKQVDPGFRFDRSRFWTYVRTRC